MSLLAKINLIKPFIHINESRYIINIFNRQFHTTDIIQNNNNQDIPSSYSHPFMKKSSTSLPSLQSSEYKQISISPEPRDPRLYPPGQIGPIDFDILHPFLDYPANSALRITDARPFENVVIPKDQLLDQNEIDEDESSSNHSTLSRFIELSTSEISDLVVYPLIVKRVVNMTRKGKIPSMFSMVIVGNRDGLVGFGEGKDEGVQGAIRKAQFQATKSMQFIERYEKRTIFGQVEYKFHATKVVLRPRPPGFGNRSNHFIHEILKCIGIQDISAKVYGSRNGLNVTKATIEALKLQVLPGDIARARSKAVIDVQKVFYAA